MTEFRLAFITQEDPFYVRVFFEEFLADQSSTKEVAAVAIAPAMGKRSLFSLARQMFNLYGAIDFVRVGFRYAYYKLAARMGRGRVGAFRSVEQCCRYYGVRIIHARDVNDPIFLEGLRSLDVDLIVSVAAPQIFKQALIDLPRLGCINVHNAPLPRYRGMLPNFWQLYHNEKIAATTIHRVNASLDGGAILLQSTTPIEEGESLDALMRRTKKRGAELLRRVIRLIKEDRVVEQPQPPGEGSYFSFPTRADAREFRRRGHRLL